MADTTTTATTISAARIAQIPAEHAALQDALLATLPADFTADHMITLAGILDKLECEYRTLTGKRLS